MKCVNLARLREFLKIPFLVNPGLRWARREVLVGELQGRTETAHTHETGLFTTLMGGGCVA